MLRDGYNVQFEGTIVRTTQEPTLLRGNGVQRDQGWSWVVLFAAFLTLFITNGMHASFGILYAALISHFGSGREETAWIGSISLGLLCFFSPVASVLIEQIGCRATSIIGAFLCSIGFLITSFATGVALLYFSHGLLFGLGTSLTYTAAMTVVARSFERRRNIATGFCTSGSQFGGISLAPLSQVLFDRLGYAVTFRIFSALLLVVAISSLVYKSELGGNTSRPTSAKKSPKEMLKVWKSKAYIVWALGTTMVTLGYNIPRYTLAKYASDQGISKDASAWLVSYLCASSAIGRITFGRLCEWIPKLYLCQACIIGCAFSVFLYPFLKSYLALVIAVIIFGLPDGGFVASLSMVTTEIVGPEKMVEGFGFMLFCQSYSNVMGPPLSGMLYDTYKSYKAAFCFAAVPEIIGFLMLFLIPYYRRNQVKYTHEIEYISNSGILNANGAASTLNPISGAPILPAEEPHGEYNVMINLTSDSPDVRLVNVVVQKAGGSEITGVSCNENERDKDCQDGGIVIKAVEEMDIPVCAREMPVCTSSLVTESVSTVEQSETRTASVVLGNEPAEVNMLSTLYPVKTSSTQTVIHESSTEVNYPNNSRHTVNEDISAAQTSATASSRENENQIIDIEISAAAVDTVPSPQLVDIVSNKALTDEARNNHETTDIVDSELQLKTSNISLQLETSASIIRIASNAVSLSDGHENPVEEIVHLHDEDVPKISPPPPHKHHVNNRNAEVHHVITADVNTVCQDNVVNNSPEAILAELDTLVKESEPATNASLTTPFIADVNNQQASLLKSAGLEAGLTGLEVGLAAFGEPALNQNPESLMLSNTFIPEMTSPCLSTAFPTEPSHISGMNDILTQKQLPEPLKPTSLSSVKENEHYGNDTQEVPPATSPLSCALSTVIADVIQSLTSQQSASQKSTKESTVSSNMTDNPHGNLESADHLEKKQATVVEKSTVKVPQLGMDIETTMPTNSILSSYGKLQTSVLHSMQSIVAEGCPEDFALLEDISIDLTLDKDPSFASIVVIDDADEHNAVVNFPSLSRELENKTKVDNDPVHDQSMTSTVVANQKSPGPASIQFSYEEQGFLGVVNETAIDTPTSTQNFAGVISNPDQLSSIVLSNEILEESSSTHPNLVYNGFNSQSSIHPGTVSTQSSELPHDLLSYQPIRTHSNVNHPQASGISVHEQHIEKNVIPGLAYEQTVTSNIVSHQPPREVTSAHPSVIPPQRLGSRTAVQEATTTSNQDQRLTMLTQEPQITPSSVTSKQHESGHDPINTQQHSVVLTQELQFPDVAPDSIATHTVILTPKQQFPSVGIDQDVSSVTSSMVNQDEAVLELFPSGHDGASYDGTAYIDTTYDSTTSHQKLTRPIESTNPFYQDMINDIDTEH